MDKRVFQIDDNCYIIYTGQSSADNISFLRMGTSTKLTKNMQQHIRFIVVGDANAVNIAQEKSNIQAMNPNNVRYICSKETQEQLFDKLKANGVNTGSFGTRNLSQDIDITESENKKHFFTIFYDNHNITIVSNEEVIFDLFENLRNKNDKTSDSARLESVIAKIDALNRECRAKPKIALPPPMTVIKKTDNYAGFFVQDDIFTSLSCGMFQIQKIIGNSAVVMWTNSQRFTVGKPMKVTILNHDEKKLLANGILYEASVVESKIMYKYLSKIDFTDTKELSLFCQFHANIIQQ